MGITTILRGFKVPVPVLDLFLRANGVMETWGSPPFYDRDLDEPSKLLRAKMGTGNTKTRLFIPYRMGQQRSTFAYIAYDWVMVFAQRKINLAKELPDRAPPGFEELRKEIMGFASEGLQASGQEEDLTGLFVIITDEQDYVFTEPYMRKVGEPIYRRVLFSRTKLYVCSPICVATSATQLPLIGSRDSSIAGTFMGLRKERTYFRMISRSFGLLAEGLNRHKLRSLQSVLGGEMDITSAVLLGLRERREKACIPSLWKHGESLVTTRSLRSQVRKGND
jgi:hypothetical protein